MTRTHHWVRGSTRAARQAAIDRLDLAPPLVSAEPAVDAHARLRGPYTGVGTLLRATVPAALERCPELVAAHDVEILSAAAELRELVPASRETLTSLAVPSERTRFYSRLRTLRLAHGLCEFFRDAAPLLVDGPRSVVIENLQHADPTDAEAFAVFARRIDPAVLQIVIATDDTPLPALLTDALGAAALHDAADVDSVPDGTGLSSNALAAAYVASDCLSESPAEIDAYEALDAAARAALHDVRAAELEARDEQSLRLGAIPWHRERGAAPHPVGSAALQYALDYCIDMGFYDATVDFGIRGRRAIADEEPGELWWVFTTKMTTSLAALGRAVEAEALYDEARFLVTSPYVHLQAAYATAMLYTRHHETEHRDDKVAKRWINQAIAISTLLPDAELRAFQTVFNHNGLALIEVHLRNLPAALRLVDEGLRRLDNDLGEDQHLLHRSVLRYNRAQVYAGMGELEKALEDYSAVIEIDPNYPEYHFDRSAINRRLGRDEAALVDIETAMRLSPPFPEVYYNRGDIRLTRGDVDGALADFSYTLELEPTFIDAYINRAGLLLDLGDVDGATRDVAAGLALDAENAELICLHGQVLAADGSADSLMAAEALLDKAIGLDPKLRAAYATRATLAFDRGDADAAVADLDKAVELEDDAAIRFNRAVALRAANRPTDALADLDRALELDPDDPDVRAARDELAAAVVAA